MTQETKKVLLHLADGRSPVLELTDGYELNDPLPQVITVEGGEGRILKEKRHYRFRLRHIGGVYPISAEYDEELGPPRPPTGEWPLEGGAR